MKNIIIIIVVCVVIIAGAIVIARWTAQPNLEKLVPRSAAWYFYVSNLPLVKDSVKETRLYKNTKDLTIVELWRNRVLNYHKKIENLIGFNLSQLEPYFKSDIALAMLDSGKESTEPLFVFLATIKDTKKDLKKYIEDDLKPILQDQGFKVLSKNFKGSDYFVVADNKPLYYYAIFENVFLGAAKEDALLRVMNLSKSNSPTLRDNEDYRNAKGELSNEEGLFLYVNIPIILAPYEDKFMMKEEESLNLFQLMGINSLRSFVLTSSVENEGIRTRGFIQMQKDVPGLMQIALDQKSRKVNSPQYIPQEFPIVNIAAYNNPSQIWEDFINQLSELLPPQKFQAFQDRISSAEKFLNINLKEDILNCLGNETALCLQLAEPEGTSEIKSPLEILEKGTMLLLVEVKRTKKFSEFLERIIAAGNLYLQTQQKEEEYKGYQIKFLEGDRISPATPSYTIIEEFFIFSPHLDSIKKAIDYYEEGKVLDSYADYLRSYGEMEVRINRIVYVDVREVLKNTPLIALNMLKSGEISQEEKETFKEELVKLGDALFGSCMVAWITRDGIMIDSYSPIGFTPLLMEDSFFAPFMKKASNAAEKKIF